MNNIIQGDCVEVMREMEENSIDTIITDPPYGIGFMGKEWDTFDSKYIEEKRKQDGRKTIGIASARESTIAGTYDQSLKGHHKFQKWTENWAREALRVTKPGGTMLCFAGVRTQHRVMSGIEDAGWILKDCIMWLYGSGFPKATDISKQLDKNKGAYIEGKETSSSRSGVKGDDGNYNHSKKITEHNPQSDEAKKWNGWKSHGLKPAYEPIIVAMKPNEGTYANNALKWGVSGLAIDKARIEGKTKHNNANGVFKHSGQGKKQEKYVMKNYTQTFESTKGRFPANILLDEEAAKMLDQQSGELKSGTGAIRRNTKQDGSVGFMAGTREGMKMQEYADKGGASRFFKVIK